MDIIKAVSISIQEGKYIYKRSDRNLSFIVNILLTNTNDYCLIIKENSNDIGKRWNPTAEDLIATDWEVETKHLDSQNVFVKVTVPNIKEFKKLLKDAENQYEQLKETLIKIEEFKIQSFVKRKH